LPPLLFVVCSLYVFPFFGIGCASLYHGWAFPLLLDLLKKLSTQVVVYIGLHPM
jgi:hypothetical protein